MQIDELIREAIREDLGDGDHSSLATIPAGAEGRAELHIKGDGILAGMDIARKVFLEIDPETRFTAFIQDGDQVRKGDIAFEVSGEVRSLLSAERLSLNFMQRMSGIATFTRRIVDAVEGTGAKVLDTRKTTPLMRELEKMAVRAGGGHNHRMGLYDMIMIKDNHVDFAGGIEKAIRMTREYLASTGRNLKIEIEVRNFEELKTVMENGGVDRVMLDNFTPPDLARAVKIIGKRFETEASGGISLDNIRTYAETGVDFISVGALTHQIKSLDMSLKAAR